MFIFTTILGQIQLQIEYGSQHGQVQVNVMEVNSLFLPAGILQGICKLFAKSNLAFIGSKIGGAIQITFTI